MILETDFHCDGGAVRLIDFMPLGENRHKVVRILEGLEGEVPVDINLMVRFGFGHYTPWVHQQNGHTLLTTAPDSFVFQSPSGLDVGPHDIRGVVQVKKGVRLPFVLAWYPTDQKPPERLDALEALDTTTRTWTDWSRRSNYRGPYPDVVNESLLALKAMIYEPSGGIVAAPTAGLPEEIGGVRNWDYRFCWIRDSSLTLEALMAGGYADEAVAWRTWVLNAVAGAPDDLQIMYGIKGERRLTEFEVKWLPGYEESRPVRVGNAASNQFQLDVYGELMQTVYTARRLGVPEEPQALTPGIQLLEFVSHAWQRPDDGIWEVRCGRQHFSIPRLWPGSQWTVLSAWQKNTLPGAASSRTSCRAFGHSVSGFIGMSASTVSTRASTPSLRPITVKHSMPACSSYPRSDFCLPMTLVCSAPLPPSKRTCSGMVLCCDIRRSKRRMAFLALKALSWPAASGLSMPTPALAAGVKRRSCLAG